MHEDLRAKLEDEARRRQTSLNKVILAKLEASFEAETLRTLRSVTDSLEVSSKSLAGTVGIITAIGVTGGTGPTPFPSLFASAASESQQPAPTPASDDEFSL
jgi:hypothetical protein